MERVKKKEKRKQIKKGWILALALVILGLVTGLLLHEKKEAAKVPEEVKILQAPQEIFVVNLPEMDVDSLAVYPRDYTDYELMRINGEMKLRTDPDTALRQDVVEDILYAAGCMKADIAIGKMDEVPDPPEAFGFDEPLLRYVIRQVNGTETQVLLGDKVPGTDAELYYCTADGMLYTVLAEPCEPLFVHEEYLRDFRQPALQSDLIDRIDITGDTTLSLQYTKDGFVMKEPVEYPADPSKMDALLKYVERMAFESYLGKQEENDLEALGLKEPCITLTLTQAPSTVTGITAQGETLSYDVPEKTYTLTLGKDTGRSGVYLGWEGGVYKGSNFLFGVWKELKPEEFCSKTPMNFQVDRLQRISVETQKEKAVYELEMVEVITENNQIATDEYGQVLYDVQIQKNGETADAETFLNWYVQLNQASLSGTVPAGAQPEGEILATLLFETDAVERKVVFRSFDALHAAMEVDGTTVFYLEKEAISLLNQLP